MTMDSSDRLAIERRISTLEEAVRNGADRLSRDMQLLTEQVKEQNGRVRRNEGWRRDWGVGLLRLGVRPMGEV